MTSRGFSTDALVQVNAQANEPIHLLSIELDIGTSYLTDYFCNQPYGGHTYLADGNFLDFSPIEESADGQIASGTVTLSGVDQTWISNILNHKYIDRPLIIYKGFIAPATGLLVADPNPIYEARMSGAQSTEDLDSGEARVVIASASIEADIHRFPGRHANDAEQKLWFPLDTGLRWMAWTNNGVAQTWGAK